ncbi:hypothetical protein L202_06809 [Cryptococcus amylolentus CBS 6039]|uniref:Superkiller protein 3 n=1 Tax=Cryptococcus amylolentus CBS 6039 TaxID=1295533 RepID=A0A1E3HF64_9TREE|nr:hypothetical protein L202_06809 [Cryptococcus amylolentus CBS 6039]ODN74406.1 hypothetical protein L202_06809 [Cryptococcus amylolentus CBS 6039]
MSTKKALKSIQGHLKEKNAESALYEATELLKSIDHEDTDAAQCLVFRGLALTQLEKLDESEKSYLQAYKLQPNNPLAAKGLTMLYEKTQDWDKYGVFLENQTQRLYDSGDAENLAGTLERLIGIRQEHGPEEKLYKTLELLLPSSPLVPLLQSVEASKDSYVPIAVPEYPTPAGKLPVLPPLPHPSLIAGSLAIALNVLIRFETTLSAKIAARVANDRKRINAGSEAEVRKNVDREILATEGLKLAELWKEVGGHPAVEDDIRRQVEIKEFNFWRRLVACLDAKPKTTDRPAAKPSVPSAPKLKLAVSRLSEPALFQEKKDLVAPTKQEALDHADGLANGFVLLGVNSAGSEEGWSWALEGRDEESIYYDIDLLHKYACAFPFSPLADFIDIYCRWFKRPSPEYEQEKDNASLQERTQFKKHKGGKASRARRQVRREKEGQDEGKVVVSEDVEQEEKEEMISLLTKMIVELPKSLFAYRAMARVSLQDEDLPNAISFAEKARKLVKEIESQRGITLPKAQADLDTVLGVALVPYFPPKHHKRATRILETVLTAKPGNIEARFSRAQVFQYAGDWISAREHFQQVLDSSQDEKAIITAKEEVGWCLVNEGKLEAGRDVLEEVVGIRDGKNEREKEEEAKERSRAWYRLGQTEWRIGDDEAKANAEEWFMASIRANPSHAASYTALGTCYSSANPPDHERALKCYQRAFELDATEAYAAHRLAVGYANEDEWAQVRLIAVRVMEGEGGLEGVAGGDALGTKARFAPQNGWAWKALGATEMHYKKYDKAAEAYQIALRADPEDVSTWVTLGEAYVKCGRHTAGLKTFSHALTIDPANWRALFDIGQTQSQLGAFDKAIEAYGQVMDITGGEEVGIVAALAEANLSSGRQTGAGGFRVRSRGAFHRAIELAVKVLKTGRTHRAWAWKLIGDATFELSWQESSIEEAQASFEYVQPVLQFLVEDDADKRSNVPGVGHAANLLQEAVSLSTTLKTAIFAFAYRAHLLKNEPRVVDPALYDYASALHTLASRLDDGEERKQCLRTAISAIRTALDRDAGDERLWNALGVICATAGPQLAQHALVVSLELYTKDPVVWVNLGYLYLRLDDRELAGQCFLKAQVMDPDYARAWYGQGLLADRNGEKEQAKALFSHSVTLSAQALLEADLALAAATFARFLSPTSAIDAGILHQPAFALKHYCHQRPQDYTAAHLYALICERLGLVEEAVSSLERTAIALEEEFERAESAEIEHLYAVALCNLGRVRLSTGQYAEALEALGNCWELVAGSSEAASATLKPQCKLLQGLAHYWLGQTDESLESFQAALDEATANQDMEVKEEVAVLLSRTLWGLGGEDAKEIAKSNLLECLSRENPSLRVISTLAAIAVVSADSDLIEASMSELLSRPISERVQDSSDQGDLVLYLHNLAEGREEEAYEVLQDAARAAPGSQGIRNRLAEALIKASKAGDALKVLEVPGGKNGTVESKAEEDKLRGLAELLEGEGKGLRKLKRSVMLAPWEEENWHALAWGKKVADEAGLEEQQQQHDEVEQEEVQSSVQIA